MKNATTYRYIIYLVFVALLAGTSCIRSERLASKRVAKLIERFPNIIDTTTKVRVDTIKTTITIDRTVFDSAKVDNAYKSIDSLMNELQTKGNCDTAVVERIKWKIKGNCTIEQLLKPFTYDTAGVHLEFWAINNKLNYRLTFTNIQINKDTNKTLVIPCQQLDYWTGLKYEWPWLLAILFLLVLLWVVRR